MKDQQMGMFERGRETGAEGSSIRLANPVDWPDFVFDRQRAGRIAPIRAVGGAVRDFRHYRFDHVSTWVLRPEPVHVESKDSFVAVQAGDKGGDRVSFFRRHATRKDRREERLIAFLRIVSRLLTLGAHAVEA
jgi:hypothetical protein